MNETVLTDAEMAEVIRGLKYTEPDYTDVGREVEAAVLAKLAKTQKEASGLLRNVGWLPEAEARRRERKAALWVVRNGWVAPSPNLEAAVCARYPLPTPPRVTRPREVTGPSGRKYRLDGKDLTSSLSKHLFHQTGEVLVEDRATVADLLLNPNEQVDA